MKRCFRGTRLEHTCSSRGDGCRQQPCKRSAFQGQISRSQAHRTLAKMPIGRHRRRRGSTSDHKGDSAELFMCHCYRYLEHKERKTHHTIIGLCDTLHHSITATQRTGHVIQNTLKSSIMIYHHVTSHH